MPAGTQFRELIDMLRAEVEQSLNRNVGTNALDGLKYRLRNAYLYLWTKYDWPQLKVSRDEVLQAGERFYSFAPDLPFENVEQVTVLDGDLWRPVTLGISERHYNAVAEGDREDPVLRWAVRENGQYEVWPTPASPGRLRMRGVKRFQQLVEESDLCQLDDLAIVYFAAAAILAKAGSPDAQLMADKAMAHVGTLQARSRTSKTTAFVMGGGVAAPPLLRPGIDYVRKG